MSETAARRNRNTELGDQACFCVACGWARRFYPGVIVPPTECPMCSEAVVSSCPGCGESILSIMAVECDLCGHRLRSGDVAGIPIRRSPRRPSAPSPNADAPGSCGCA